MSSIRVPALEPRHSAFCATPLHLLLLQLGCKRDQALEQMARVLKVDIHPAASMAWKG